MGYGPAGLEFENYARVDDTFIRGTDVECNPSLIKHIHCRVNQSRSRRALACIYQRRTLQCRCRRNLQFDDA
jgi:hypothetical protein